MKVREVFIIITEKGPSLSKAVSTIVQTSQTFVSISTWYNIAARAVRVTRRDYLQIRTVFNLSVSCHSVKLKEKTWLNCSEKFSLTMHHEFSSSCFRIKILVQKKICIHQTSMRGDDRGLKRERNFIYKKCEQDQIFLEHPKKAWWYAIPSHVPCKAQPSASIQWPVLAGLACRDNTVPGK